MCCSAAQKSGGPIRYRTEKRAEYPTEPAATASAQHRTFGSSFLVLQRGRIGEFYHAPLQFLNRIRQPPDALLDFRGRESAVRKPQETFASAIRKKRQTVGKVQIPLRSARAHRGGLNAFRQRQRKEKAAVRARGLRIRHVLSEGCQAGVQTRRIKLLELLDLRSQQPAPAPFVSDALRQKV